MVKNRNLATAIIKPDYVLTSEGLKKGWGVRIEEGRIARAGSWGTLGSGGNEEAQIVCLSGQMSLPGFVNRHNHIYGVLSHGIAAEVVVADFSDYPGDFRWPHMRDRVGHGLARVTARWACVEMTDSGVTSFMDTLEKPNSTPSALVVEKEGVEKTGLRGFPSSEACERKSGEDGRLGLKENFDFAKACNEENGFVEGVMSIHTLSTCGEDFTRKAKHMADEAGCLPHMYMSKNDLEPVWTREHLRTTPVEAYDGMGCLDEDVLASQLIRVTSKEIAILAEKDVDAISIPLLNCEVGGGIAPIEKMLKASMTVGPGTDGYVNNFFEVMRGAFLIHKDCHKDP